MGLPPGPVFLCRLILRNLLTLTLWYGIFYLLFYCIQVKIHAWLAIPFALSMQLIANAAADRWRLYRDVAASGATLAPLVSGGLSNIITLQKSLASGYPADVLAEWREQYGEFYCIDLLSEDLFVTFEPEHIKAILATQFDTFEKGQVFRQQFADFLGTGVFNADGDMWKFHRGMTRPFFNRERITDFDIFDRHASNAIGQVADRLKAGYPVDFQDMAGRFSLDSAAEFLFGSDVSTLSAGLPYPASSPLANSDAFVNHPSNIFMNAFAAGQFLSARRTGFASFWPLAEFWQDRVKPHRMVVDNFIEPILAEALAKRAAVGSQGSGDPEKTDSTKETLLSYLLNHTQDTRVVKDELVNLMLAGRDTTTATLTFAIYMLTQHPHITRRLREEILDKVGNSRPTFEQLKDMKYLRAFINETLRLYPPLPADGRTPNKATVLPSTTPGQKPIYVSADRTCIYSVFIMHRRTDLWGPDAHDFDPDRFIDERLGKYLIPNPFIFVPFNAGPRICLGQQFAYHEVSFLLVRLLQRFSGFTLAEDAIPANCRPPAEWSKIKGSKGTDKVLLGLCITINVKGGLWVRMEEASRQE